MGVYINLMKQFLGGFLMNSLRTKRKEIINDSSCRYESNA